VTKPGNLFDVLKTRGEEAFTRVSNELMQNPQFIKAMQTAGKGKALLDQAAARALTTMIVPTRSEFKRAVQRIEQLERELTALRTERAATRSRRPRASRGGGGKAGSGS
jgi:hypothetical protein